MAELGITSGCAPGYYCPGDPATRGQMAVFIIRALYTDNFTYPSSPVYFPDDVPPTHHWFRHIQRMRHDNITTGCSPTRFCVDDPTLRFQAAIFAVRARQIREQGFVNNNFTDFSQHAYFFDDVPSGADPNKPQHFAYKFIQKARDLGMIAFGCGERTFCPDGTTTRGEASY